MGARHSTLDGRKNSGNVVRSEHRGSKTQIALGCHERDLGPSFNLKAR